MADALTREGVQEIAHLARIALSDDEVDRIRGDLGAILGYMDALEQVDTEGVAPLTHAVPIDLHLRPDDVDEPMGSSVALAQAPAQADGCFQVPFVIKSAGGE